MFHRSAPSVARVSGNHTGAAAFQIWEDDSNNNANCATAFVDAMMNSHGSGMGEVAGDPASRKALQSVAAGSRKAKLEMWKQQKQRGGGGVHGSGNSSSSSSSSSSNNNNNNNGTGNGNNKIGALTTAAGWEENVAPLARPKHAPSSSSAHTTAPASTSKVVPTLPGQGDTSASLQCSVYTRASAGAKWRKRGSGKGRVAFVPSLSNVTSLQVRASTTLQLLANFSIGVDIRLVAQSSKSWTLSANDFSADCQATRTHFMLRFSSTPDAQAFHAQFLAAQGANNSTSTSTSTSSSTTTNSCSKHGSSIGTSGTHRDSGSSGGSGGGSSSRRGNTATEASPSTIDNVQGGISPNAAAINTATPAVLAAGDATAAETPVTKSRAAANNSTSTSSTSNNNSSGGDSSGSRSTVTGASKKSRAALAEKTREAAALRREVESLKAQLQREREGRAQDAARFRNALGAVRVAVDSADRVLPASAEATSAP